jgi:hypothetical protein
MERVDGCREPKGRAVGRLHWESITHLEARITIQFGMMASWRDEEISSSL